MASINKAIIVGHCGRDPETRTFPSGDQVCNVTVATSERWKDKQSGEMREATEWHRITLNGKLAEIAASFLHKGALVYFEGQIRTRKYTDKDGVEKYSTEIRADRMQMLGGKPKDDDEDEKPRQSQRRPVTSGGGDDDGDIPFNRMASGRAFLAM